MDTSPPANEAAPVNLVRIGTGVVQIGRYRILDELGRGATGVVYRAQDPAIGRTIAIKTIRLSDFSDDDERDRVRERLFREAQSAGILSHPNIVTIYDIAEENGMAYIFMECVDGPPLEKILSSQHPLDRDAVLSILDQTATALDYAHKKGIVHRDIKPANILIHESATAKITDFGVAKILSQQMTVAGVMMGTPNYMSPEQVQGHAVDGRADQFSLAVIAYELLTGEKPFVADQLPALLFRIVREDVVAPERLNPTLAPQVGVVIRKALSKSAADRYPNCTDFVQALAAALALNPNWHALPRSVAQNMPTIGGAAPVQDGGLQPAATPPVREQAPVPSPPFADTAEMNRANPVLKSLVWMLVGIGLVGLVLFGAQKYLFNRSTEPPPAAQASDPADQIKPSPVGEARAREAAEKAASKPASPPETTSPVSAAPASPAPDAPSPAAVAAATPAPAKASPKVPQVSAPPRRSITPPPVEPKADAVQSVQFVTVPPHALVTVDGNQACRAPCLLSLSSGRHSMNVTLDGYRPYPKVFNVPAEDEIFLQLTKASGTLSVTSNPSGASIEINGEVQARRTPAVFNFAPGSYRVKVSRSGASLEFDVQLKDGEFITKRVDF